MFLCKIWYNFDHFNAIKNLLVPKEAENKGLSGNYRVFSALYVTLNKLVNMLKNTSN